jgi:hypothetical protein
MALRDLAGSGQAAIDRDERNCNQAIVLRSNTQCISVCEFLQRIDVVEGVDGN